MTATKLDLDQYDPARTLRDLSEYCLRQPNEAAQQAIFNWELIHKLRVENEAHRKRLTADLSVDKATLREQIAALRSLLAEQVQAFGAKAADEVDSPRIAKIRAALKASHE